MLHAVDVLEEQLVDVGDQALDLLRVHPAVVVDDVELRLVERREDVLLHPVDAEEPAQAQGEHQHHHGDRPAECEDNRVHEPDRPRDCGIATRWSTSTGPAGPIDHTMNRSIVTLTRTRRRGAHAAAEVRPDPECAIDRPVSIGPSRPLRRAGGAALRPQPPADGPERPEACGRLPGERGDPLGRLAEGAVEVELGGVVLVDGGGVLLVRGLERDDRGDDFLGADDQARAARRPAGSSRAGR